jgi:hypothetical protein
VISWHLADAGVWPATIWPRRRVAAVNRVRCTAWSRTAAVLAAGLLAGVGCVPGGSGPASPVPSGSPGLPVSPTPPITGRVATTDSGAGDRRAVTVAYRRFWTVVSTVDSQPRDRWPDLLAAVAAEPLLSRLLSGFQAQAAGGSRQYGEVVTRPTIVRLDAEHASIVDCQDASRSGLLDTGSGLPSTAGSSRAPVAATLQRGPDGGWRVSDARYLDGGC